VSRPRPINYYDILGIPPDAAPLHIRSAYFARIGQYHPDRNPTTHATAIAALVNEAWAVLGDAERRRQYDATAGIAREPAAARTPPSAESAHAPVPQAPPPAHRPPEAGHGTQSLDAVRGATTVEPPNPEPTAASGTPGPPGNGSEVPSAASTRREARGFGAWLRSVRQTVSGATGNRRAATRLKTLFTVSVHPAAATAGDCRSAQRTCLDLSPQGLAIAMDQPMGAGTLVTVTLELPDGRLAASAAVVRCEALKVKGRWKVGIEFIDLAGADRRRIREFVREEGRSRVG
jgi:curved DNA-binding protein CbpA